MSNDRTPPRLPEPVAELGTLAPADVHPATFDRLPPALLGRLSAAPGLTATVSDVLDRLAADALVPAAVVTSGRLRPRLQGTRVAGHAVTLGYLPARPSLAPGATDSGSNLAHDVCISTAAAGDVLVIDARGVLDVSALGGMAAVRAAAAGIAAVVVDGTIRDLDEFREVGLPAWSRSVGPRTGKWRLEPVAVNAAVCCGGCQVRPGDLVVADDTGVCFVPPELARRVADEALEVTEREARRLPRSRPTG